MNALDYRVVGSAVQAGMMAMTGYYDGWSTAPYCPDWAVTALLPTGDRLYPWRVVGFNLNVAPGEYGHRFDDRVPFLTWRYRFELCAVHP